MKAQSEGTESHTLAAGRYRLGLPLGSGGMGEVREAWDDRLDRPVAVKLLRAEIAGDAAARRRFETEGRAAGRIVHPNVVTVFDTGDPDDPSGVAYIVMERLPGGTLRDRLAGPSLTQAEARSLGLEVLAALDAAHRAGVIHRDIKPGNILASGDGRWKVGDFGIAKTLDEHAGDQTATALVVGTPAYLAPERLHGHPATVTTDLFSVGVILYEALTLASPFPTYDRFPWSAAAAGTPAVPVRQLRPDVDPSLASVIDRSLALDPAGRFSSAAEMGAAITATAAAPNSAYPAPAAPTVPLRPGGDTQVLAAPTFRSASTGRRRAVLATTLATVTAVAALLLVLDPSSHSRTPATTTVPSTSTVPSPTTRVPTISIAPAVSAPRASAPPAHRVPAPGPPAPHTPKPGHHPGPGPGHH